MQPTICLPVGDGSVLIDEDDLPRVEPYHWVFSGVAPYLYAVHHTSRAKGASRTVILMHRLIMDAPVGAEVDHISGDRLDNRKANLRVCTRAENMQNRMMRKPARSAYKGVHWDAYRRNQGFWRVELRANGRRIYVGRFDDEIEAAHAYDEAARRYHGTFARLNFPD